MTTPSAPAKPPTIPGIAIGPLLGVGGMACVYRAQHQAFNRAIALKVIHPGLAGDPVQKERLLKEARTCQALRHPNTIGVVDSGETATGVVWIAFELATGGDLLAWLRRQGGKAPETDVWRVIRACLEGLAALEAAGLVHRDLKPANVFSEPDGGIKLADFGLVADGREDGEGEAMIVGTPAYMPPEQVRAEGPLDVRADLYALGATAYHLLCGRPPFEGSTNEILVQVLVDPVPDPKRFAPQLSEPGRKALMTLLCKERSGRPPSVRHAISLIDPLLGGRVRVPSQAGIPSVDTAQLANLAKRILIDKDALEAAIILAPGASFPRVLLEPVLRHAKVVSGIIEVALVRAGFPEQSPRRLIVARGDRPAPGIPGRNIHGDIIPALPDQVQVRASPDRLSAWASVRPGTLTTRSELERAIEKCQVRHGVDPDAMTLLCEGPPPASGKVVIARGRPPRHGTPAGFANALPMLDPAQLAKGGEPVPVAVGAIVAVWKERDPGAPGVDIRGRELAAIQPPDPLPNDLVGEGLELIRDAQGRTVLRAVVAGVVQADAAGRLRLANVRIIEGDVGPGETIQGDDVVVVRGSVRAGAVIRCTTDLVVTGDLEDAIVETGGDLVVRGAVGAGKQPIVVAGNLTVNSGERRPLVAGSLRVEGDLRGCDIGVSGDVTAKRIVGGRVIAGGTINCQAAGDGYGQATELWAGHQLVIAERDRLARLAAGRVEAERLRLRERCRELQQELGIVSGQDVRARLASFTRPGEKERIRGELHRLEHLQRQASDAEVRARGELVGVRKESEHLHGASEDRRSSVRVDTVAYPGVTLRLADGPPELLGEPRLRVNLGITREE